jgi:hypothetical protein
MNSTNTPDQAASEREKWPNVGQLVHDDFTAILELLKKRLESLPEKDPASQRLYMFRVVNRLFLHFYTPAIQAVMQNELELKDTP